MCLTQTRDGGLPVGDEADVAGALAAKGGEEVAAAVLAQRKGKEAGLQAWRAGEENRGVPRLAVGLWKRKEKGTTRKKIQRKSFFEF